MIKWFELISYYVATVMIKGGGYKMETILGRVDCLPEETGYDSSRLEVLNRHLERIIDQKVWERNLIKYVPTTMELRMTFFR